MEKDVPAFVPTDSLSQAVVTIAERSQQIVSEFLDRQIRDSSIASAIDPLHIGDAFLQMTAQMLASPVTLVEAQMSMWNDYMQMWQSTARHLMGSASEPAAAQGWAWRQSDIFDFIKQTYLLTARWIQALVRKVDGLDEDSARQIDFYTKQFIDTMDPSCLFANNPDLLQITIGSKGENLVKGLDHLLGELDRSKARLAKTVGAPSNDARIGKSVAATRGEVLFRNRTIELLHYAPTTATQLRTPMLIIPPSTHKFYALDLRPANSLVKWAVDHGHRVFMLSWADHDEGAPDRDLAATIAAGPVASLDAIRDLTGESRVNGVGFGLGGTLLAATQAWHAAKGEERWLSASYLASLLDFADCGELSVFVAEEELQQFGDPDQGKPPDRAVIDLLRANDLIWSFIIDCFQGERPPFPFDLLRWNADSLTVPPALQLFYLRDLYQQNLLCKPGGITLGGLPVDLASITTPAYLLALNEDHLAPWPGVFAATHLLGGSIRFVRAGSGHLSGLVNPPNVQRFGYFTNPRPASDAASWSRGARRQPGSWWEDWHAWLLEQSGAEIPTAKLPAVSLAPAPGNFVG